MKRNGLLKENLLLLASEREAGRGRERGDTPKGEGIIFSSRKREQIREESETSGKYVEREKGERRKGGKVVKGGVL